jgi:L-2-hydroxyglutarate oxidase LhgO
MTSERVDCIVIGAGVVGLAVARALAIAGREVFVVEREPTIGSGISSRNSEVIHAGLYYPPGSHKARLCVRGKALLYEFCDAHRVPHRRIGKIVVAVDEAQREALAVFQANARVCGVDDTSMLDEHELAAIEPAVRGVAALWSPSTGIVDSHALMLALQGDAERHGAVVALASEVVGGAARDGRVSIETSDASGARTTLAANSVINCAGLDATRIASSIDGVDAAQVPRMRRAKGHYFAYAGASPFSHLVYPMPEHGGLGVHATLDLGGQLKFGPDVEWLTEGEPFDYVVDGGRRASFEQAIRKYWPDLPDDHLAPAYTGIRPKLTRPGEPNADFVFSGPRDHGVAGLVHCFGIESPGLTSSLAIAEHVASMFDAR